jgi:hypothetical protein
MAGIVDNLFGPLSSDFCLWFYFLSILGLVWFFLYVISAIYLGLIKKKGSDYWIMAVTIALGYGIIYFQNRLLHSMCAKSLGR